MSAVLEMKEENVIVEFNEFEALLVELERDYGTRVYDLTDPKEAKAAGSDRLKVAKAISSFEEVRKARKAKAQAEVKLVDGKGKIIRDRMEAVRDSIKAQIDARKKAEQERMDALQGMVDEIRELAIFNEFEKPDASDLSRRLETLNGLEINDSYQDRKADATLAQVEVRKQLEEMLVEREKHAAEQAELEKLRKEAEERERKDREEAIRKEAEEKAKREAEERAEREKRDAATKAQAEIDAANKAREDAEQATLRAEQEKKAASELAAKQERERIEKEQRDSEAKAEKEKQAEEAKKAKQTHRAKIHKQAKESFIENGFDTNEATLLVELIKEGKIKNVFVNY